jgi:hypothetical protein
MTSPLRKTAQDLLARMRNQYAGPHTVAPAQEADFRHLDLNAYAGFQSDMDKLGFKPLGDVELLDISQASRTHAARTMIRGMLSGDGHVAAAYFQYKSLLSHQLRLLLTGLWHCRLITAPAAFIQGMKTRHSIELSTEFSDGRFLYTMNSDQSSVISVPPSIERWFFAGCPVATLLAHHLARVQEILSEDADVRPVAMTSVDDVLQMQARQKALKDSHRVAVQWITREELLDMAKGNQALADALYLEVQKVLANERNDILQLVGRQPS